MRLVPEEEVQLDVDPVHLLARVAQYPLVIVPGGEHSNITLVAGADYDDWIRDFIGPS